jgi:hypothetical protein
MPKKKELNKNYDDIRLDLCKNIQNNISNLSQNELYEIFKILHNNNSNYTKNNNGIFINLNWLDYNILEQINNYIIFCIKSHKEIKKHEIMKNIYNDNLNKYKNKNKNSNNNLLSMSNTNLNDINNKNFNDNNNFNDIDIDNEHFNDNDNDDEKDDEKYDDLDENLLKKKDENNKIKISSSMKFYLFKKKFAKKIINTNNNTLNILVHENSLL